MSDVIAWICRTPRRLLTISALTLVVIVAGAVLIPRLSSGSTAPGNNTSSTGAANSTPNSAAGSGAAGGGVSASGAGPYVAAALRFATAWSKLQPGQTADQWRASVTKLATPELAAGLALTDPSGLPGGTPIGTPLVRFVGTDSALVSVPLTTGSSIAVTVVRAGTDLLASDVHPDVGDAGDIAGAASP